MDENSLYEKARKRVKRKKEFYQHLTTYLVMSGFFFALNRFTSPETTWWIWPVLGWGLGVVFDYFDAFGMPGVGTLDDNWEEQQIQEEIRKMKHPDAQLPEKTEEEYLDLKELRKEKQNKWDDNELV